MRDYPVRTAAQLPAILQAYRKQSGLTQTELARRLGITQQSLSALERNADKVSADRLIALLNILGVEVVLRQGPPSDVWRVADGPSGESGEPSW